MPRAWIWLQLLLGWLPVGALFALSFYIAHGPPFASAALMAAQLMLTAALLGLVVHRYTQRVPWPHPMRAAFVVRHILAAAAYAFTWFVLNVLIASILASVRDSVRHGDFFLDSSSSKLVTETVPADFTSNP